MKRNVNRHLLPVNQARRRDDGMLREEVVIFTFSSPVVVNKADTDTRIDASMNPVRRSDISICPHR
jgi:hypothetical protein